MKKLPNIVFIITATIIIIYNGCKDKVTTPPEEQKPPGYQEDIPWPSLANSPWPIFHGDPQNTGRSKYPGPTSGFIQYVIENKEVYSGVTVGEDSSIYFVSKKDSGLFCYSPDGKYKWNFKVDRKPYIPSTPLVASDGTIYFTAYMDPNLYAIKKDGTLKWKKQIFPMSQVGINISKDGAIFLFTYNGNIHFTAMSPQGDSLWSIMNNDFNYSTSTFSPDGKTIYICGGRKGCYALDIETHQIKWSFGEVLEPFKYYFNIVSDFLGNIYLITGITENNSFSNYLFSLNNNGEIRWKYKLDGNIPFPCAIDKNGNIYFGSYDVLYSIDYYGNLRWKYKLKGWLFSDITIDSKNNLYFAIYTGTSQGTISVSSDGVLRWENYNFSDVYGYGYYAPTIGYNSDIFISLFSLKNVYSLK